MKTTKHIGLLIFILILGGIVCACSTTSALSDDEQLYVGIRKITYNVDPGARKLSRKEKKCLIQESDTTGVITSMANAAQAIDRLLKGEGNTQSTLADLKTRNTEKLTKEEKETLKAEETATEEQLKAIKTEVDAALAYAPNNAIFGSSSVTFPLKFGLWFYNKYYGSEKKFGRWMFKHFSTQPILISTVSPELRAKVAENTLHNYGYFRGSASYDVIPQKNRKKAKVSYNVQTGPLFHLNSVEYLGYDARTDSILRSHQNETILRAGNAFSTNDLTNERARIERLFRNNGYYYYTASYTTYSADTINHPGMVDLHVKPEPTLAEEAQHPWYIGRSYFTLYSNDKSQVWKYRFGHRRRSTTSNTLTRNERKPFNSSTNVYPVRRSLLRQSIAHRHGELYRLTHEESTMDKLSELGILSQYTVNYIPSDTTDTCDTLDVYITATLDKLYDSALEMNATLKSNQQIGPGVSYELARRNAFKGAEKVAWKIFGSYEWQMRTSTRTRNSLLNSYELGTELSFSFPRFFFPIINKRHLRFPASTKFAIDADWKNRSGFFNMLQVGASATYNWHKNSRSLHEWTLIDVEYDKTFHTTTSFDSIMKANPALSVSMRNQFVPSMSYCYTWQSPSTTKRPIWFQGTVKESGNIVSGVYAACGKSWTKRDKSLFGSPFAQYVKVTAEVHHSWPLNTRFTLASRFFSGAIFSYGNSKWAPYADQFYAGGANSIRAFAVRSIGPGGFRSANSKYAYIDQTGDFKLEANAELRMRLFGSLYGAIFLDAGNVWLLHEDPMRPGACLSAESIKKIALGTGAGLRYDLDFLVLRLDFGIGLHAPYTTTRSGFYNFPRFRDGFAFHFAIGYPF